MQTGDKISFGQYTWLVLDIQEDAALLITDQMIGQRPYHNKAGDVSWADCELRTYLNNEVYQSFNEEEQAAIMTVTNKNMDNPWYGEKPHRTISFYYQSRMQSAITSATAVRCYIILARIRNTGFRGRIRITYTDRLSMMITYGGGFAHPDAQATEPFIYGEMAISEYRAMQHPLRQ